MQSLNIAMLRLLAIFSLLISSMQATSFSFSWFLHHPPYQLSLPYTMTLKPSSSLLISSLQHQKLLSLDTQGLTLDLIEQLKSVNTVHAITQSSSLLRSYLEIEPDIVILPRPLEKKILSIVKKYPTTKPLTLIFYETPPPKSNLIIENTKEQFLVKKSSISKEGKTRLNRLKKIEMSAILHKNSCVVALGESEKDIALAMGGLMKKLQHHHVECISIFTMKKNYKKDLFTLKEQETLYVFMPYEMRKTLHSVIKTLKAKNLYVAYYPTPYQWNLDHSVSKEQQERYFIKKFL